MTALPTITANTMSRIHRTTVEMTDASAPIPACFALTGFSDFQTRKRMRPTIGKKNPSTAHPNEPVSAGCCPM